MALDFPRTEEMSFATLHHSPDMNFTIRTYYLERVSEWLGGNPCFAPFCLTT